MKRQILTSLMALTCLMMLHSQQTLWVAQGHVKYAFDTQQVGQMPFSHGGDTLTIQSKAFAVADIDSIYVTDDLVESNTVTVDYQDSEAWVTIAGNIASALTPTVNAANVSMAQDTTSQLEVFYTLSGTSSNGSFYHSGDYKATLILNGLTLTSTSGPAINIDDGKRIEIQLVDSTTTTLADGAKGTHKAAFVVEGHSEFKGAGTLVLTGNTKHGFKSDEYMELKKSFTGLIRVKNAKGDGVSINQYLEVKSGSIIVEACEGDGIQIDAKTDTTKEFNGQFIMSGGLIQVAQTGDGGKGIKVEADVNISDGVIELTADDNALSSKGNIVIGGGKIYAYSAAAHGISSSLNLTIAGGDITAFAATTVGYSLRGATNFYITGGNIAAVGALVSTPKTIEGAQPALTYQGTITKTDLALTDASGNAVMAFAQQRNYSSSKKHTLLLSMPTIAAGSAYTLCNGATLDATADNWHGMYTTATGITATGMSLATGTAAAPYSAMQ